MQRSTQDQSVFELGSEEWAALPDLGIPAILAKVDTGARTSALHATRIEVYKAADGQRVRFTVHPVTGRAGLVRHADAPLLSRRWITSSNGSRELRCVVAMSIDIGGRRWPIEVTLTNRRSMRYRMLLGQRAILADMIVVPSRTSCQTIIGYGVYDAPPLPPRVAAAKPATGLRIALLGEGPVGPLWQALAEAGARRGHVIERIDPRHCRMILTGRRPSIESGGRLLPHIDGVIALFDANTDGLARAVLRHLQRCGAAVLNSEEAMSATRDPELGFLRLHELQIPLAIAALTGRPPGDTDIRPDAVGTAGNVVSVLVVAGSVRAGVRSIVSGPRKGRLVAATLTLAERRLAVRAARALRLDLVRIDLVRGQDGGPAVMGIVATPALAQLLPFAQGDVGARVLRAIEQRAQAAAVPVEG